MTTGKRIKKRRTELGLTVDDLAKSLAKTGLRSTDTKVMR